MYNMYILSRYTVKCCACLSEPHRLSVTVKCSCFIPLTPLFAFLLLLDLQTQQFWHWAAWRSCVVAIPLIEGFTAFIQGLHSILTTSLVVIVLDKAICVYLSLNVLPIRVPAFVSEQQPTLDGALELKESPSRQYLNSWGD